MGECDKGGTSSLPVSSAMSMSGNLASFEMGRASVSDPSSPFWMLIWKLVMKYEARKKVAGTPLCLMYSSTSALESKCGTWASRPESGR
jgi:hypothetical protein